MNRVSVRDRVADLLLNGRAARLPNIGGAGFPPSKYPDDALLLGAALLSPTIEFSGEHCPVWQVPIKQ